MLEEYLGEKVVIDLTSPYVCLGTLSRLDEHCLEVKNADLHDLRDTDTTRELYVVDAVRTGKATGIKRNRKKPLLFRRDIVAVGRLEDFVDD